MILHNIFAYIPFSFDNKVLVNNPSSFQEILGVSYMANSVMSVEQFLSVKDQYSMPGIYGLYCIVEGKFYIGSAYSLSHRLKEHLVWNRDSSRALQEAIGRYGLDKFQVVIFNTLPESLKKDKDALDDKLYHLEQWFFNNVEAPRLYNIVLSAEPIGSGFRGPHRAETKIKISESSKGKSRNVGAANHMSIPIKVIDLHSPYFNEVHYFESFSLSYKFLNVSKHTFLYHRKRANGKPFVINKRWLIII